MGILLLITGCYPKFPTAEPPGRLIFSNPG